MLLGSSLRKISGCEMPATHFMSLRDYFLFAQMEMLVWGRLNLLLLWRYVIFGTGHYA
jgi:hypothetical protein